MTIEQENDRIIKDHYEKNSHKLDKIHSLEEALDIIEYIPTESENDRVIKDHYAKSSRCL